MVGYSEKGWLKWKMRRGKWPDLGLNPFPFHFSFINNPPTTQSSPTTHSRPHLHPSYCHIPPYLPPTFPLAPQKCSSRNLLERECVVVLFSCGSKQRVGKIEKEMVDGKVAMRMSLSVVVGIVESLSLKVQSVLTLERSLDLKKAALLALLNLQSQDARYRSQRKHSTHRPSNQWGAAGLPGRGWLIKEKENKQQGKGRA